MDLITAGGYEDSDKKNRQQRRKKKRGEKTKKLNSFFPGVDKLNREGNKRAGSNRKSPKISENASKL